MGITIEPGYLRSQIVGGDSTFETPFGRRLMVYCDYTASGRCLRFVENYLQRLQRVYANTHTEDDITGRSMSQLLHSAEASIKRSVNAGPSGRIVACGTGATGAIDKLQQIIGVAFPPATRQNLEEMFDETGTDFTVEKFRERLAAKQPVVFVGPYEHHSNELSWRQGLSTTVEVRLDAAGGIDLGHLRSLLERPEYLNRLRIGSFSAASNVTGLRTDVRALTELLHEHHALALFDYAASGPYVDIDMNPQSTGAAGRDPSIDAIFLSPHKFLGGPGASGVLVFNERIYRHGLPPSFSAGGTVDYVGPKDQDFIRDIEEREKAGTPGVLQTLKAALVFQIKDAVGVDAIEARELEYTQRVFAAWGKNPRIEILGCPDPDRRVGIISFNVRGNGGRYLHHKFVTAILNDLFGIQSRAGCSCAGPYGHALLNIDNTLSERYRRIVREGHCGMKPGWCRVGMHWVMDDAEVDYIISAVDFVARHGDRFLDEYRFNLADGAWLHRRDIGTAAPAFSLESAVSPEQPDSDFFPSGVRKQLYDHYLMEASRLAEQLAARPSASCRMLDGELGELQFFDLPQTVC